MTCSRKADGKLNSIVHVEELMKMFDTLMKAVATEISELAYIDGKDFKQANRCTVKLVCEMLKDYSRQA